MTYKILDEPKVSTWEHEYSRCAYVQPYETETLSPSVTVVQSTDLDTGVWEPSKIVWPSIGEVTPDEARAFARAVVLAATIANDWDKEKS